MSSQAAKVAAGGLRRVYPRSTNRPSLDANLCSVDRLKAQDARLNQVTLGGSTLRTGALGNVIDASSGPSVTDSVVETTTYINLQGGTVAITLPDATNSEAQIDTTLGLCKTFVMMSAGTATITPSSSPSSAVTLSSVNQSCTFIWNGGGAWGISSGGATTSINYNTIHDRYMDITLQPNAGPNSGIFAAGGAFFVSSDGYAVTASHIVLNDENDPIFGFADLYATVYNYNGTGVTRLVHIPPSSIIGVDGSADIGVFRVPGITNQNFFEWGDASLLNRGDDVYLIGQPGSFESADLNKGQIRNPIYWDDQMTNTNTILINFGQEGNSGGPLINQHMQVVGVLSEGLTSFSNPQVYPSPSLVTNYATTASLDAQYVNGPPGMIQANANNVALSIDGHVFAVGDVGVTTFLLKDGIADMTAGYLEYPDQKSNGTYLFTQLQGVGQPWQATRIAPFVQSSMPQQGQQQAGVVISSTLGLANASKQWMLQNTVTQIDNPRQDNVIFTAFNPNFPEPSGQIAFANGDISGATSQTQAQPICDRIIAGDRLSPLPNPVLNALKLYNQKGWLGCNFAPWINFFPAFFNAAGSTPPVSALSGAWLTHVDQGGVDYPIGVPPIGAPQYTPIEVGFCTFFSVPLGTLTSIVNGHVALYTITSVGGIRIGSQTNPGPEVPVANVLYSNPPGTVVDVELTDVYHDTFVGSITFQVTLGSMPANLDHPLAGNFGMKRWFHPSRSAKSRRQLLPPPRANKKFVLR